MNGYCRALGAAIAAACVGGAAHAEGTIYYYDGTVTRAYNETFVPGAGVEYNTEIVTPAPRVYYAPVYTRSTNTTYYYSGWNHDSYVGASPGYMTVYEPRVVYPAPRVVYSAPPADPSYYYSAPAYARSPEPYGYVPPGLSITTPVGTYAPLYGGWSPYSTETVGGYDGYRNTNH